MGGFRGTPKNFLPLGVVKGVSGLGAPPYFEKGGVKILADAPKPVTCGSKALAPAPIESAPKCGF